MKLSFRACKVDSSGRHNDRNFDLSKAPHIDPSLCENNRYYTYNGEYDKPFRQIELEYYEKTFGRTIKKQNEKNKAAGHSERNKTVKQYYSSDKTRPEDMIIQVGKRGDHISAEQLWNCAMEYKNRLESAYGDNCKILTMALHVDEPDPKTGDATPHVHIRRAWTAHKTENELAFSQDGALKELGIPVSNGSEKLHTRQVTFTQIDKEMFRTICSERSIELEPEPTDSARSRRQHLSVPEFKETMQELEELERKCNAAKDELEKLEPEKQEIDQTISDMEEFLKGVEFQNRFLQQLEEAKDKSRRERLKAISDIFKAEMQRITTAESIAAALSSKETEKDKELAALKEKCETLDRRNHLYRDFIERHDMGKIFNEEYSKIKEEQKAVKEKDRSNQEPSRDDS